MTAPYVPPPPPPPPGEEPPPRKLRRPYVGGLIGLVLAAAAIACCFLPWLVPVVGDDLSGWDLYREAADTGENPLMISEFFRTGFSPFFTGLAGVIAGGLLAVCALAVMIARKVPQPARYSVPAGIAVGVALLGFLSCVPPIANLISLLVTQRRPWLLGPGYGLILALVSVVLGYGALVVGITGRRPSRRPAGTR